MSGPFPRFTSGGIGSREKHLTAEHVNRITDATVKVESMPDGSPSGRKGRVRTFFAKVTALDASDIGTYRQWEWEQVAVDSGATDVTDNANLLTYADYPAGQGLAVELGAQAEANDIVLMHELVGLDGVRRFAFAGGGGGGGTDTWCQLNATQSGGTITTGVAPTDLGDGIFEYKAVPVKITGYSGGVFTVAVDDDPRFAIETSYITALNVPMHWSDGDWKYAGVNTSSGSDYPSGYSVRGIGEERDPGGGSSTWRSPVVRVNKYTVDSETTLWLFMAEPDHDGSCTGGGGGSGISESQALAIGAMRA